MKLFALTLMAILPSIAAAPDIDPGKVIGGLNAPITIEVYSSFACSHCKEFHEKVLPRIIADYVVRGKAAIVSRETFPPQLQQALEAAQIATAAARIGKYQEVSEALFRDQDTWMINFSMWNSAASVLSPEQQKKLQTLAKDPGVAAEVQHDQELARSNNVTSTPTLIVTKGAKKYPYAGVPDYALFKSLLDGMLK